MSRVFQVGCVLLLLSACDCGGGDGLSQVVPGIELSPLSFDFAEVPAGATRRLELTVHNPGTAELQLDALELAPPFRLHLKPSVIRPGEQLVVDLSYTPTTAAAHEATLIIESNAEARPSLELSGVGVEGFVQMLPREIFFPATLIGDSRLAEVVLLNGGAEALSAPLSPTGFARPEHFSSSLHPSFALSEQVELSAGAEVVLDLEYHPLELAEDAGYLSLEVCGPRCGYEVSVEGRAVGDILWLDPPELSFGEVALGDSALAQVEVVNDGDEAVQVLSVEVLGGNGFTTTAGRGLPQALGAGSRLQIAVEFKPSQAIEVRGQLVVQTSSDLAPELRTSMSGSGSGPFFVVQPEALDFGVLPADFEVRRSLLLLNSGSAPLRILDVEISGDAEFRLAALVGLPITLQGGETLTPQVAFQPTEEGEFSASVRIQTDDPAHREVLIPVQAGYVDGACQLDLTPSPVRFGVLPLGHTQERQVTVTNRGDNDCTLIEADFQEPSDPYISADSLLLPITLAPGDSQQLVFRFSPTDAREARAIYGLTTSDQLLPYRALELTGTSIPPLELLIRPPALDFGVSGLNCRQVQSRRFEIINTGVQAAVIERVEGVFHHSVPGEFGPPSPATRRSVPPGGSLSVSLPYEPADVGVDTGEVEVYVENLPFPLVVPLLAEGADTPRAKDVFTQEPAIARADMLWVIDNSCSMGDEQASLAANVGAFVQTTTLRNVNLQLGITTTDTSGNNGGLLVGPILNSADPGFEQAFAAQANLGISGAGFERGLEAMFLAVEKAKNNHPQNQGLLRQDTPFIVVLISDEEDQSFGSVATYFAQVSGWAPDLLAAAVTGRESGCGSADESFRYPAFVRMTGGISASICSDWATTLSNIGTTAFGLRRRFPLSQAADTAQPIEVRVDGVLLNSGYSYDAVTQSVLFQTAPPPTSEIEINYSPAC